MSYKEAGEMTPCTRDSFSAVESGLQIAARERIRRSPAKFALGAMRRATLSNGASSHCKGKKYIKKCINIRQSRAQNRAHVSNGGDGACQGVGRALVASALAGEQVPVVHVLPIDRGHVALHSGLCRVLEKIRRYWVSGEARKKHRKTLSNAIKAS